MKPCARSLAVALVATQPLLGADWSEFRGPTGQGVSTATGVPVRWGPGAGIVWKTPAPGSGWSSPVLAGGRLYLTSAVREAASGQVSLRALSVDARTGRVAWDVEALRPDTADTRALHDKNTLASPTPVVSGDRLYMHFGHLGTAALDLSGRVLWRQTGVKYQPVHGGGGSPVVAGGRLVFSCDGASDPFVVALDMATGKVAWKTPRSGGAKRSFSFSTPLAIDVRGAQQIVSSGSGYVAAYAPADGREIWRVGYGEGFSVVPRPVYAHGLLFVATGYDGAGILAIDPAGARGDATATHVRWSHARSAPMTPSPLVLGDEIYFVSDNGIATCLDARSGRAHWTERLGGNFSASPVAAEGRIYFTSEEGVTSVVKAAKKYELIAANDLGERSLASPAMADGAVFLRTAAHLWRVGR
jgi:outer membrane protein assembly factor BamB